MSESEIVYQLSELYNRYWTILQWWTGTSFILIGVSHIASRNLNRIMVAILVLLYSLFTFWLSNFTQSNIFAMEGFIKDLTILEKSASLVTFGAKGYLEGYRQLSLLTALSTLFSMYLCTVGFLIYSKFRDEQQGE